MNHDQIACCILLISLPQTALLREVLSSDQYHVLHFDLRIPGFADISSLYLSFSQQMEQYFEEVSKKIEGYGEFEKEGWTFKVSFTYLRYGYSLK